MGGNEKRPKLQSGHNNIWEYSEGSKREKETKEDHPGETFGKPRGKKF